jgi:hypothetical protein
LTTNLAAEITNGRLAMLAIIGCFVALLLVVAGVSAARC